MALSYLIRAMVATVYYETMKPLLVACIENVLPLLAMIKMGEEIDSIIENKYYKDRHFMQNKIKIIIGFLFSFILDIILTV